MDNIWIWLVVEPYPPEKYEFVNLDDYDSQPNGKIKMTQTTNQVVYSRIKIWGFP